MPQPVRILHVIDKLSMDGANPSSVALLLAEWVRHRDATRFEAAVAVLQPPNDAGRHLEAAGVRVFYLPYGKYSFAAVSAIVDLVRRERIALVHLHGYRAANFGRLAARRARVPAVMHEHARLRVQPHQYAMDWLLRRQTDVAIAVSETVRGFLVEGRAVPRDRIRVVWNGVAVESFQAPDPDRVASFRREFGVDEAHHLVGTITRLREEKGNRYLIEAAVEVCRACPNTRFVIVGDGPLRRELEDLRTTLGLDERLFFAGFRRDIDVALAAMDVVTVPSLTEGLPLAVLEAAAAGRPLAASAVGGTPEIITSEVHGLLVPAANAPALAAAVVRLLRDPALAHKLGQAARERSRDFSIERNVAAIEHLYDELLGGHAHGAPESTA
jgi:glycosyltransferase involved in cell wall biosynthesis